MSYLLLQFSRYHLPSLLLLSKLVWKVWLLSSSVLIHIEITNIGFTTIPAYIFINRTIVVVKHLPNTFVLPTKQKYISNIFIIFGLQFSLAPNDLSRMSLTLKSSLTIFELLMQGKQIDREPAKRLKSDMLHVIFFQRKDNLVIILFQFLFFLAACFQRSTRWI